MQQKLLEQQKIEAVKRIRTLFQGNILKNILKDFLNGVINKSESGGFLYHLNLEEDIIVRQWEKETGNVAYHVILSNTSFGKLMSIFYVSKHEEEWDADMEDIIEGYAIVYVKNLDNDYCSEYGSIAFESKIGGLIRTA